MDNKIYTDKQFYNETLIALREDVRNGGTGTMIQDIEGGLLYLKWQEEVKKCQFGMVIGELSLSGEDSNTKVLNKNICSSEIGESGFNYFREQLFEQYPHLDNRDMDMPNREEVETADQKESVKTEGFVEIQEDNKSEQLTANNLEEHNHEERKEDPDNKELSNADHVGEACKELQADADEKEKVREKSNENQSIAKNDTFEVVRIMPTFSSKPGFWNKVKALGKFVGEYILVFIDRVLLGREVFSMMYRDAYSKTIAQDLREEYLAQHPESGKKEQSEHQKEIGKNEERKERPKEVEIKESIKKDEIIQPPYIRDPHSTERVGREMFFRDQSVLAEDMYKLHAADVLSKAIMIPSSCIHLENTEHDGRPLLWITINKGDTVIEQFGINDAGNAVDSNFMVRNERKTDLSFANKCTEVLSRDYSHNWRGSSSMPSTAASKYYVSKFINEMAKQMTERDQDKVLGKISNVPAAMSYDSKKDTYLLIVGTNVVLKDASRETLYSADTAIAARKALVKQQQIQQTFVKNDIEQNGFFNGIPDGIKEKFEGLVLEESHEELETADEREEFDFGRE